MINRFERALHIQYQALQISTKAFDDGFRGEATRLANAIFILLGIGMRNHTSILEHLKKNFDFKLPSSVRDANSGSPLIFFRLKNIAKDNWTITLFPIGTFSTKPPIPLSEWWSEIVLRDDKGNALTRLSLIRSVRDQDGGSHVDDEITDPNYKMAVEGNFGGFHYQGPDGSTQAVPFSLECTVRQIANEVLSALHPFAVEIENKMA